MDDIDLGFPEKRESKWLTNRYFPSKVGGSPAWLELGNLPQREQLLCGKCNSPKAFLCQLYSPSQNDHNFHRSIYIFVCRTPTCQVANLAENITVLRSQLPRKNHFYSENPPNDEGAALPPIVCSTKLCTVCGCRGPSVCSRCKAVNYCSVAHQRAHWPRHKQSCGGKALTAQGSFDALTGIVFPEYEVVIESDPICDNDLDKLEDNADTEEQRLAEFAELVASDKTGELSDLPDSELDKYAADAESVDDKHFRKFKKEVDKASDQIIRYHHGGEPLWIANVAETVSAQVSSIPCCSICGGPRHYEFQIMPQMLLLLNDDNLDWGVLVVYTCAASCKIDGYVEEYIVKQDILTDKLTAK